MTITLGTRPEAAMAAPLESQATTPFLTSHELFRGRVSEEPIAVTRLPAPSRKAAGGRIQDQREMRRREYEAAETRGLVDEARRLADAHPSSLVAQTRLLQALVGTGRGPEAVDLAERIVALSDDSDLASARTPLARYLAAVVLAGSSRLDDAESVLARLSGNGPWVRHYAAIAAERQDYSTALTRLGDHNDLLSRSYRGYVYFGLGRPQDALHELRAAQRLGDDSPTLWCNIAYAHAWLGRPERALQAARRAVAVAPEDRQMSFNLASYMRAVGDFHGAIRELLRISSLRGSADPMIAAALAHAYVSIGDFDNGVRVLRRAVHHHSFEPDAHELAELHANLAFLRWRTGDIDREKLRRELWTRTEAAAEPTVSLVRMLANFARYDDATRVQSLYDRLAQSHSEDELVSVRVPLAALQGRFELAAHNAIANTKANPLDADAATEAVYLRACALGEFSEAGDMGIEALARIPADRMLLNNTAYALAMAGRGKDAQRVLDGVDAGNDPYLTATQGLVHYALGDVQGGNVEYERAADLIRETAPRSERDWLLQYLRANQSTAGLALGLSTGRDVVADLSVGENPDWNLDPRFLFIRALALRLGGAWGDKTRKEL
jgi:tetratricopeptide (TPR) repeat protein